MRRFMKSSMRYLSVGWFWASVVLVLPNCSFDPSGVGPSQSLYRGPSPHSDVIFCDIEKVDGRHCSTAAERDIGILFSDAAIALVEGRTSGIGLDDSPEALGRCGGQPETVMFQGEFPKGFPVCLNCGEAIGPESWQQADLLEVCKNQCVDFVTTTNGDGDTIIEYPPTAASIDFCNTHARLSTNMPVDTCFGGGCTDDGAENMAFPDPRKAPEPVIWTDRIGTDPAGPLGSTITRSAPTTGMWDASAVSQQWITKGNGYMEFGVTSNQRIGLTVIPPACAPPCHDTDPDLNGISFSIDLGGDGRFYVFEGSTKIVGPDVNGSFGTYVSGDRFRMTVRDAHDGTLSISFARVIGVCTPGMVCNTPVFHTRTGVTPGSFRADAALIDFGSSFDDVRIVFIK